MDIFSPLSKQEVLNNLFELAKSSNSIPAIRLYLDLINEQINPDELTTEKAIEILRQANESQTGRHSEAAAAEESL